MFFSDRLTSLLKLIYNSIVHIIETVSKSYVGA